MPKTYPLPPLQFVNEPTTQIVHGTKEGGHDNRPITKNKTLKQSVVYILVPMNSCRDYALILNSSFRRYH
jgi:hypothetical protein